jgi:hypothetical protein
MEYLCDLLFHPDNQLLREGLPSAWVLMRLKEVNCLNVNGLLENNWDLCINFLGRKISLWNVF